MSHDDLELPDPSEPTEEVGRYARLPGLTWPFDTWETILLGLLYVAPFVIRWLTYP